MKRIMLAAAALSLASTPMAATAQTPDAGTAALGVGAFVGGVLAFYFIADELSDRPTSP